MLYALLKLAEHGSLRQAVLISSEELAKRLKCSQQSASRYLIALERAGLIRRTFVRRGELVEITKQGREEIEMLQQLLSKLLREREVALALVGRVFTGLCEGAYYVSHPGYKRQFIEKLGFEPYPGTLNLRLASPEDVEARRRLDLYPSILIEGFRTKSREFGAAKCYRALINDVLEGAVVTAMRSHYDDTVLELLAPVNLRKKLGLRDGDEVRVTVFVE